MALADEGCEIPVEMIGLCWLRDSRRRMTQIRWERPNWTLMTHTFPDLPRPNRRGFSRDAYDVAHNHCDAARTSPRHETALDARNTRRRRTAWLHRGDIARPWVQRRYVSRPRPRRARHGAPPDHEGGQTGDPVCPHNDHGRRPEGDRGLIPTRREETLSSCTLATPEAQRATGQRQTDMDAELNHISAFASSTIF